MNNWIWIILLLCCCKNGSQQRCEQPVRKTVCDCTCHEHISCPGEHPRPAPPPRPPRPPFEDCGCMDR